MDPFSAPQNPSPNLSAEARRIRWTLNGPLDPYFLGLDDSSGGSIELN